MTMCENTLSEITVIVPCYNSEKTLKKCLDSLISQTMRVTVYVMNDGSTDRTQEIAERFARDYNNIQVFFHNNIGLPQTRKAGLARVQTKYTAFVDSDDWIEPDMLQRLYTLSEKYKAEISVCELFYDYDGKSKRGASSIKGETCLDGKSALQMLHKRDSIYPYMWNKLFLTTIARTLQFPEGNFLGEDYATLVPWIEERTRIAVTDVPLYHYIIKESSMSKCGYGPAHHLAYQKYIDIYTCYSETHTETQCEEMACYLCVELAAIYVAMIRNSNYDREIVCGIRHFISEHIFSLTKMSYSIEYLFAVTMICKSPSAFRILYRFLGEVTQKIDYYRKRQN